MTAQYPGGLASPETLLVLVMALVADALVGDMAVLFRIIPHPVRAVAWLVEAVEPRLNREKRSAGTVKRRGGVLLLVLAAVAAAAGWAIAVASRSHEFAWILELFFVTVLITQRGTFSQVRAVAVALRDQGLDAGRAALGTISAADRALPDGHAVARAAIESCAERFCRGVVAPAFWYILLGLPGLAVYTVVDTTDGLLGRRSGRYRAFGLAAARTNAVMALVPARIAGLIVAAAALFTPHANPARALKVMVRDAGKHAAAAAGWPQGAMAGALDLALAGPRRDGDSVAGDPWIGDGRARATAQDIHRALYLYAAACLVHGGLVALLAGARVAL